MPQPTHQRAAIRTEIPGPRSRALREQEDRTLAPGLQGFALMAGIVVDHARGSAVTDVDGNTFLDLIGGIGVNGLGHSHPAFVEAVQRQVERAAVGSFTSEARVDLLARLEKHSPGGGRYLTQLYSSGAEAVESALRLAKCYTGKTEFVSFWGGFHGKTMGSLSLMGSDFKTSLGPTVPGAHIVPYANPYRPPFAGDARDVAEDCVDFLRKQIKFGSCGDIAAILVEPMQGTAGNVIPPKSFLRGLRELASEIGALLICDEMITGFGRTGRYWGSEHSGVEPDIVTLGKQFGGGFPISAVMAKEEIARAKPWSNPSGSSSSYGGNPLAAAAAAAALRTIDEEDLVSNSARVGEHFLGRLKKLEETTPFIGDVRGAGLFIGVELVRDRETKEPLPKPVCEDIFRRCLRRGLLTMAYAPSFRIQPAMTIDTATVDHAVDILEDVFTELDGSWRDVGTTHRQRP